MDKANLPIIGKCITIGSKVMCVDGSYTLSIMNKSKELKHTPLGLSNETFTVIAINVVCPTDVDQYLNVLHPSNNCIIASNEGDIHFVSKINIKNVESAL